MAISIKDVKAGKFFVCDYMVREIIREKGDYVVYYTYLLNTGEPMYETSDGCSKRQITRKASREATPEEIARMQTLAARGSEEFFAIQTIKTLLPEIPDEMLIKEVKRRGLTISQDRQGVE